MQDYMVTSKPKNTHLMDQLISSNLHKNIPRVGEVITGIIISVGKNEVIVDIPGLSTGIIRGWEIIDESGQMSDLKIGDEVQATVVDLENERGMMELSFRIAGHQKAWEYLNKLKKENTTVEVKTIEANKGGLIVELGKVLGFLPVSQLAPEHYPRVEGGKKERILEKLREYVGKMFTVKVIDVDESEEKLIVSERAVEEDKQIEALSGYSVGDELDVKIVGIVDFGLFVEIPLKQEGAEGEPQALEGLIHISEISWQRVDNLQEQFNIGDTVKAKIIEIKGNRVSLSIKQMLPDPWKDAAEHYVVGQIVKGKIIKMNDFGAFVELEHNIHGLAHISELNPSIAAGGGLEIGKEYEFKIVNMDIAAHRLGLSQKALAEPTKEQTNQETEELKN